MPQKALTIEGLELSLPPIESRTGADILGAILVMASKAVAGLQSQCSGPSAVVGRLRGTGREIHFRDLVAKLEADHPITLRAPFEDSQLVAGAAWDASLLRGGWSQGGLAKLRWSAGADDLPMHIHEHSDRFIIVDSGRGYFHVSNQDADSFDGSDVRTIPARERDVFLFTRGVVHTFSTAESPMTLLSCQLPYMAFDDPRQYRLPSFRWIAREQPELTPPRVACDPAWYLIAYR
jgi:mannose-6-phosphate isomerase-like protein (cupin superfamily)